MFTRCNGKKIILADNSKVGRAHNFSSGTIEQFSCLVTDSESDPKELELLRENDVDVIVVDIPHDNH